MNSEVTLPPPKHADSVVDNKAACTPRCVEPMADIVHITGDRDTYYVLTEKQRAELMKHIDKVDALMKKFRKIIADAAKEAKPKSCEVISGKGSENTCPCVACRKLRWAKEAEAAGLLALKDVTPASELARIETSEDIQGRISQLKEQRQEFAELCKAWNLDSSINCKIGKRMPTTIDAEIEVLKRPLPPVEKDTDTTASGTTPSVSEGGRVHRHRSTTLAANRNGVAEIIVISRPDRHYYISQRYVSTVHNSYRVEVAGVLDAPRPLSDGDLRARGKQLLTKIREKVARGLNEDSAKPLGNLEAKLVTWPAKENCAVNALHREVINWSSDRSDDAPYAANAEAHLLRFAAQASAGFSGFNPKEGEISVGVKAQASFALAEGKVSLERYIPDQDGYDCFFSYRNAEGKVIYHRFGAFRMKGALELSCFVGAVGTAAATAGAKWKSSPSGASAMLTSPELSSRGGAVKLQGSAFAGAQAGGALLGAFQWIAPEDQHRPDANWSDLLTVKGEGNVALGAGGELDFQIMLSGGRLYFHLKAQVVLGPGAAGGFGTMVDLEKAAGLIMVVYRNLSSIDYRYLLSINEGAFDLFSKIVTKTMSSPGATVETILAEGLESIQDWWNTRKARLAMAQGLAKRILEGRPLELHGNKIAINELPPEVIGPALYILGEDFKFSFSGDREKAIIKLLRCVRTWRHFFLTLERITQTGQRNSAMEGLNYLRQFLSPNQTMEFSKFIDTLAASTSQTPVNTQLAMIPWNFALPNDKYEVLMAARKNWPGSGGPTMTA
ncbi:hypothetical protein DID96_37125 [Burkholderia sp. Bp8963]|uniref:hypothetical protein n=1 Tax=Burkholderia sp. Bp8963 TaxID=2184547 RepID=UPI000F592C58|nr:hypothetical protein [Burkholderia sp. Bp8963]RQS56672.1 hypothetical protein DID96_37125 [Burkholderia sp. Bp8963]